ncbi:MAG: pyruvate:ferredoxin (flavodoxin) oxidoreductase [Bacilli bacterium]|nr:pyruvate:ferredoxin (flavodoxin) oxidoreductase [Bacilli bacterium]
MKKITVDGNEACAHASYMFTEVAGIYPITPSSPMPEHIDSWASMGRKNIFNDTVKVVEMESEAGAIGMVHGSLQSGMLTSTYTASQGLLLMIPNMYKIAGEMLPCVIHVATRSLATHALSIFGDHQDVYATRMTGFCMLSSSNVQDAYYLGLVSHLAAIKSSLPFMHFFDGFRTSHEYNKIDIFEDDEVKSLLDLEAVEKFRNRALSPLNPVTRGTNQNGDIYFQMTESRNLFYDNAALVVCDYMNKINEMAGTDYKPFNYYGSPKATKVIVAMGSVCDTIKETINYLGGEIGLVEVHLYRPFSIKHLLSVLPSSVKNVAVLDRTKEPGSNGEPLYLDIANALGDKDIKVVGGRYGLSSKDTTPGMIKAVFDSLDNPKNNFTIGINDDVTNLSLEYSDLDLAGNDKSFLLYGYGSDGTVSAAKTLLEIAGNNTDMYVQGYFEYDSKKSGGVTASHLRFSPDKIRKTYFVNHPELVVVTKDSYLKEFDMFSSMKENGILIINTIKTDSEILEALKPYKRVLNEKNITVYTINAYELARKCALGNKISMIMASVILKVTNLVKYDEGISILKELVTDKFSKKSEELVSANILGITEATNYLKKLELDEESSVFNIDTSSIYNAISHRMGNTLKVSDFKGLEDGTVTHTLPNGRILSDIVPRWLNENCIQCGMCSLVCPHGVIRPFLLSEDEYSKAPDSIKNKCLPAVGIPNHYFIIGVSKENCTGCGVCVSTCPGKGGDNALNFEKIVTDSEFDYLIENISVKDNVKLETIKGSQLRKPKFAFHGACAGCGETAYIKLLTQMFGESLVIANATGCSSIYGASSPDMPYEIPWANSLFEDNAEFGYGMLVGYETARNRVRNYMSNHDDDLFEKWLSNSDDYSITKEVYDNIDYGKHPELLKLKNYIMPRSVWAVGGDGWAYDIGFNGIDHVLASGDNINILVLDSQVYSNTGGQSSKATPKGAVAQFASDGKKNNKKDLARIAMSYPNVYVATVSIGANMMQVIKAFEEASKHNGPSIIIAYTPCISHGIKGGMKESVNMEALATKCGYFPTFRYNDGVFVLDSKNPDFDLYEDFLLKQTRYSMLKAVNPEKALELLKENKDNAINRFEYYKKLSENK